MISQTKLTELAGLDSDEGIVSLYIGIEPRLLYERGIAVTKLKSAYNRFERGDPNEGFRAAAEREWDRIFSFVNDWKPNGRGLAIFACEPAGIWEALVLDVYVPTLLQVDTTTRTGILTQVLDEYPRFVAAVVQRGKAAIYVSEQREQDEPENIETDVPNRHKQGGWAQSRMSRHVEFHAGEHLREVVEALEKLHATEPFDSLAIGGTAETTAALEKHLPEALRSKLIGTFAPDVKHSRDDEILAQAHELRERAERGEEIQLVESILDNARSGQEGVVGVEKTLEAIQEGKVREIALVDDLTPEGFECTRCEYFTASAFESCPLCGAPGEAVSNVLERALEKAYLSGSKVNFVFGEARERLSKQGGVGALLRY